jgi:hypothetical protein
VARRPVANHDAAAVRVTNAMSSHATAGICARRHDDCAWNDNDRSAAVRAASVSAVAMKAGTAAILCQCRRAKFLIQPPVAGDVLDIVRHHGEHKSDELGAETRVAHRRKGPPRGWRRADGGRFRIAHRKPSMLRSVRATSGSMMHLFEVDMLERIPDSEIVVRPAIMSMVDRRSKSGSGRSATR